MDGEPVGLDYSGLQEIQKALGFDDPLIMEIIISAESTIISALRGNP